MLGCSGKCAVLIAGPTGSGKSAAAMALGQRTGGVIINADAMQVYRDLRILTSRPSAADEAVVAHRLYGQLDGAQACSAGQWLEMASTELRAAWSQGFVPIVTGGTGLYFRVLEFGLAKIPAVPDALRQRLRARLKAQGPEALHDELSHASPQDARAVPVFDGQRIVRALEVLEATGRPLASFHREAAGQSVLADCRIIKTAVVPERQTLYARCDARFDKMLQAGALDEVAALASRGLSPELPVMKAIGVRALGAHLAGSIGLDEAIETAKRETRNYAKRQMTWVRHQMAGYEMARDAEAVAIKCSKLVKSHG